MFVDEFDLRLKNDSTYPRLCVDLRGDFYISYNSEKYPISDSDGMKISQSPSDDYRIGLMYQIIAEYLSGRYSV